MRIKNVLKKGVFGLLVFVSTFELVGLARAGNCLWYCDDQIAWVKKQHNEVGHPATIVCTQYSYRYQGLVYTDDASYQVEVLAEGQTHWKHFGGTRCNPTCEEVSYPVKADGSPQGRPIREGNDTNHSCSMRQS